MAERPTYKLRFLDPKKRFPAMPEQPAGRSYGVVWKLFGEDQLESCYVVEFVGKSHVSLLGYVSVSGEVYKVDRPVSEAPLPNDPDMELVLDESDSSIGEIMVREANGAMRACAQTAGSPEGPMREQSDHETWNSTRALPYGEFMASMFLRYVIFANSESAIVNTADAGGLDEGMQNVVDKIKLVKLPEPVEVFLGFNTAPLPDAIETLLYRVDHAENPSGIERYAAALMSEIDLPRLRTIAAKSEMSLARIDRSKIFYLNFDRSLLDQDEIDMLLAIECRLNRLSGILERIGAGLVPAASSPSLEAARSLMRGISPRRPTMFPDCSIRLRAITRGASRVRWLASRAASGTCAPVLRESLRRSTWSRGSTIPIGQTLPRGLCSFGLGICR